MIWSNPMVFVTMGTCVTQQATGMDNILMCCTLLRLSAIGWSQLSCCGPYIFSVLPQSYTSFQFWACEYTAFPCSCLRACQIWFTLVWSPLLAGNQPPDKSQFDVALPAPNLLFCTCDATSDLTVERNRRKVKARLSQYGTREPVQRAAFASRS